MANKPVDISFGDAIPPQALRSAYTSITVHPPGAPALSFRIALPKDWAQISNPKSDPIGFEQFHVLAAFAKSDEVGIQILATLMPWEINLVDWLEYRAHVMGMKLLAVQSAQTEYGQTVHGVAQAADGAHMRLMVTADGPILVISAGRMPMDAPADIKESLGLAAASFEFAAHSGRSSREPLIRFRDGAGLFQVMHPASWTAKPIETLRPAKSGVDLTVTSESDTPAYCRIEADTRIERTPAKLDDFYGVIIDEIQESGIRIDNLELVGSLESGNRDERMLGEFFGPNGKGLAAISLRPAVRSWLACVLLCPDTTVNPHVWMRGKRAFEIATSTLEELPGSQS